jgi:hypothetical protein
VRRLRGCLESFLLTASMTILGLQSRYGVRLASGASNASGGLGEFFLAGATVALLLAVIPMTGMEQNVIR